MMDGSKDGKMRAENCVLDRVFVSNAVNEVSINLCGKAPVCYTLTL